MTYKTERRSALLTAEEERILAARIARGRQAEQAVGSGLASPEQRRQIRLGREARHRFMEANLGLVLSIASKMRAPGHIDRQDMIQDGMIGLERAVEKFDGRKGYKFSTYATWWIRQAIQRGLENTTATIRIPAHRASELNVALSAVDGDYTQLPPALAAVAATANVTSLDRPIYAEGDGSLADTMVGDVGEPESAIIESLEHGAIKQLLAELQPTTRYAVIRRFGLDHEEPATYGEIGAELGIGGEAARRRVIRALGKLRSPAEKLVA